MGELLKDVKIIKCEVLFKEQYLGAPLADEVIEYIESKGFRHVGYSTRYEWFGDALFINEKL